MSAVKVAGSVEPAVTEIADGDIELTYLLPAPGSSLISKLLLILSTDS